ncbi:hypothetical protein HMPREF1219_01241 [Corynebacterium pyruviciproducens ATCC BAA-1742]|uniref:LPXTG-domain-containing protein cell wall anchor domain n=1 Tax=Corynebacterium pyruviciproducens ATCC BAA-1742 TaxID=1125779 RepID=S2Z563_9CORY|nr:hypothetical protein [Corynebacterium pyruviciproducens]EPD69370.1 hypothetical protein HMPREF1219_01241 [Corynebacterium pyruviciproducens ATCC BAA-1742]
MAHKKTVAVVMAAALSVTGAVFVPSPALAAYATQGTEKSGKDVFWLDFAGLRGPDGKLIPGKEVTVPGLDGYTVTVKVGKDSKTVGVDKRALAFEIPGEPTLVGSDAKVELTVTLTKDGKPEPLTLVVPDVSQDVKVTTSAGDWRAHALDISGKRLGSKSFSALPRPATPDTPLVATENKDNSTTLTLELGKDNQKMMVGVLKERPADAAAPVDPIAELGRGFADLNKALEPLVVAPASVPSAVSAAPSAAASSSETTTTTAPSSTETTTSEPTPTESSSATTSSSATVTSSAEPSPAPAESSSASAATPVPDTPMSEETTTTTSTTTTTTTTKEVPSPAPTSTPRPTKPAKPAGSSAASDSEAIIGTVVGLLVTGGMVAGLAGGTLNKALAPSKPSGNNDGTSKTGPQQKKPKVTVKQPGGGDSLTLAELKQQTSATKPLTSNTKKTTTKTKVSAKSGQKKPKISVGKSSSKKKSTSKKKLADTGAPVGLPVGIASLLIMSGLILLGVRQTRRQI